MGYGDITPSTTIEIIYVMIMTLLSAAIFAYSINTIGSIFKDLEEIEANFKKKKFIILNYMRTRNISKNIQMKIIRYLEYIFK